MAVVQSTYTEKIPVGRPGMIAGPDYDAASYRVEPSAGLGFGLAVGHGTDDEQIGLTAYDYSSFVGVTIMDQTRGEEDDEEYPKGIAAAVLYRGDIWVTADGAVTAGGDVTFDPDTGEWGSKTAQVDGYTVVSGGTGYTSSPTITTNIIGTGYGTITAGAVTRASNVITAIAAPAATARGSYLSDVNVVVTGGAGSGAVVRANLSSVYVPTAQWVTSAANDELAILRLGAR